MIPQIQRVFWSNFSRRPPCLRICSVCSQFLYLF